MTPEKRSRILAAVAGLALGAAAMFFYSESTAGTSACDAFDRLASGLSGSTTVGRTTTRTTVINPGTETSYVGVLIFGNSNEPRAIDLRRLFDRCIDETG